MSDNTKELLYSVLANNDNVKAYIILVEDCLHTFRQLKANKEFMDIENNKPKRKLGITVRGPSVSLYLYKCIRNLLKYIKRIDKDNLPKIAQYTLDSSILTSCAVFKNLDIMLERLLVDIQTATKDPSRHNVRVVASRYTDMLSNLTDGYKTIRYVYMVNKMFGDIDIDLRLIDLTDCIQDYSDAYSDVMRKYESFINMSKTLGDIDTSKYRQDTKNKITYTFNKYMEYSKSVVSKAFKDEVCVEDRIAIMAMMRRVGIVLAEQIFKHSAFEATYGTSDPARFFKLVDARATTTFICAANCILSMDYQLK